MLMLSRFVGAPCAYTSVVALRHTIKSKNEYFFIASSLTELPGLRGLPGVLITKRFAKCIEGREIGVFVVSQECQELATYA